MSCQREGVVWMELKLKEGRKVAVGVMYANPEGVRTDDTEDQFEEVQEEIGRLQEEGYEVVVMGDFNQHIGLGVEQQPNRNGRRLLNLVWAGELIIGNELPQWQSGEVDLGVWAKKISNWLYTVLKGTSCGENADWGFREEGDKVRPQSPMVWSETRKPRRGGVTGSVQVENWWEKWLGGVPGCSYGRVRRLGRPTWWAEPEPWRRTTSWGRMGELDEEGHYSSRKRDREEEDQRELKRLVVKRDWNSYPSKKRSM